MDTLVSDLRFAARTLRRHAAFSLTVIVVVALAIGASTAIFSVVQATLLRPLPFRTPERIVFLQGVAGPERAVRGGSVIEVQDWARRNRTLEAVAMYDETSLNLATPQGAERVDAEMVSASYFAMVGARTQLGRAFTADEDRIPGANPVVVISDAMWRARFAADPRVVGRTIDLNERPFTIVGVMVPGFRGISFDTDVWFPAMMMAANGGPTDLTARGDRWLGALGRLKDGVTMEQAQRDLDGVARQLAVEYPQSNADRGVELQALRDAYLGSTRDIVLALFAAVGLLLLIACANVLGLQIVRASARAREVALRVALGVSRTRLARQLVVEALLLAGCGALLGLLVARWGLVGLATLVPAGVLPSYAQPAIDLPTLGFTLAVTVACGLLFGLVPAARASRLALADALRNGSRGSTGGRAGRGPGGQQLLVVGQTAVALVLLVGAGLYVRSLQRQLDVDPGFAPAGVTSARVTLPDRYDAPARLALVEQLRERLRAVPQVRGVAIGSDLPLAGSRNAAFIVVPESGRRLRYYRHSVAVDYFPTLGIRLLRGRAFGAQDHATAPRVAIVNASAARRIWGDGDPVGRELRLGSDSAPAVTIVGVVADARFRDLTTALDASEPDVFFPMAQRATSGLAIGIRSSLSPEALVAALRREVAALDPQLAPSAIGPLDGLLAQQTAGGRLASTVLGAFGATALLLATVGLYGVLAFVVGQRRREIGIRIALGATRRHVVGGIVGKGVAMVGAGLAVGMVVALAAGRAVQSQLFGVGAADPVTYGLVTLVLLAAAVVASWIPARRATHIDPQVALRAE